MKLRFVTVAWGEAFIDRFLRLALRTLLAPGNIPSLIARHEVAYSFFTTPRDAERLLGNPLFQQLARTVDLDLVRFSPSEIQTSDPSSHWILWRRGTAQAQRDGAAMITVAPDHLFARDTLQVWTDLLESGRLAIFCPGVQVVLETIEQTLGADFPAATPIDLSRDALTALMFRHLHPVNITMFRDSPRYMMHPEYHLRAIAGKGFTQNIVASHAVAFWPGLIKMNDTMCPLEQLDRVAFVPSGFLSAESLLKFLRLYLRPWRLDADTLGYLGQWADFFMTPANIRESAVTHGYGITGPLADLERRAEANAARFYVQQVAASRRIHRLWHGLRSLGLREAPRWLAAAHMHGRLRRRLAVPETATVYVPSDTALARLAGDEVARLLAHGGDALIAALRAHVAPGHRRHRRGDHLPVGDGARGATARILEGPTSIDGLLVYVVDRPFGGIGTTQVLASDRGARPRRARGGTLRTVLAARKRALIPFVLRHPTLHALVRVLRRLRPHETDRAHEEPRAERGPRGNEALDHYRRALAWRGRSALDELFGFYQRRVLAGTGLQAAPAQRLATLAHPDITAPLRWLADAVAIAPEFAEAWLELGYFRLDHGDHAGAAAAFERAVALPPTLPRSAGDPHHRTLAACEWASLLAAEDRVGEALDLLGRTDAGPRPWRSHLARARLMLADGQAKDALDWFERAMQADGVAPQFADLLPQDLDRFAQFSTQR